MEADVFFTCAFNEPKRKLRLTPTYLPDLLILSECVVYCGLYVCYSLCMLLGPKGLLAFSLTVSLSSFRNLRTSEII